MKNLLRSATLALAMLPFAGPAQAQLATTDAGDFVGTWTISLEGPQGAFEQSPALKDEGGKVVGEMTNQIQPDVQKITDVSKEAKNLVLKFAGNFQGHPFDAVITITPEGADTATVAFDINGGQFSMSGTGTRTH